MRTLLLAVLHTNPRNWRPVMIRIPLGLIFLGHGAQKVFGWFGGHGLGATAAGFEQHLGISRRLAYLAAFTELFGGLFTLLGFLTRPAALGIATIMGVATGKVHWRNGFFMNWGNEPGKGHGIESTMALGAMALTLAAAGGGAVSVDAALTRELREARMEVLEPEKEPETLGERRTA